jgi:hypothetical protein
MNNRQVALAGSANNTNINPKVPMFLQKLYKWVFRHVVKGCYLNRPGLGLWMTRRRTTLYDGQTRETRSTVRPLYTRGSLSH